MHRAPITTHVLNLDTGKPAAGISVCLCAGRSCEPIAKATTDSDGRIVQWDSEFTLSTGDYRLSFAVSEWFALQSRSCFYSEITLSFSVNAVDEHYHVPLLLNAYGYSTYRGS